VLKNLQSVQSQNSRQQMVDKAWERLLEIVLFVRTGQHRTLAQILKAFIGTKVDSDPISKAEMIQLRALFKALRSIFTQADIRESRMGTDQPYFYTLATSIHALGLVDEYGLPELKRKLSAFGKLLDGKGKPPAGTSRALKGIHGPRRRSKQPILVGGMRARKHLPEYLKRFKRG
jgi:hypothetical protein